MQIFLEDVFEFAPDAIFLVAPDGGILSANKQAETMFGYSQGELNGRRIEDLIPERLQSKHTAYREGYISQPRARAMGSGLVLLGRRKGGSEFPVDIMLSPLGEKRPPTVMAFVRDVTERTRTEAEKLDAINTVARSVAHDLRNPLTAIASASYVLDAEAQVSEKGKRMLTLIDRNVVAADRIVKNLLDFSSVLRTRFEDLRVDLLLEEILAEISVPANIAVVSHYEKLATKSDPDLLRRAVANLVANAIESMPSGGTLSVGCRSVDGQIAITIIDTGLGMSEETMMKLGTLFFTTKAKGLGIGFAISKKFIESAGGTLGLTSELGKGTTVTVSLGHPLHVAE
jgi:protein-histidine pros-kinase